MGGVIITLTREMGKPTCTYSLDRCKHVNSFINVNLSQEINSYTLNHKCGYVYTRYTCTDGMQCVAVKL